MSEINFKTNKAYKTLFDSQERYLIAYGSAGSGKSVAIAQKLLVRIMSEPEHRFLVLRKFGTTIKKSTFQLFRDLIAEQNLSKQFKLNKSELSIEYLPNNNTIMSSGLDDVEKLKSIQGVTGMWIEEASEIDFNDFTEIDRRLRGQTKSYKQIILSFNPISHLHWLKTHFFDKEIADSCILKTTYLQNKFIDDKYKEVLENMKDYDYEQYRVYALGEWGVLNTNKIYHNYKPDEHKTDLTINDFEVLYCGIDFNIEACCVVVCGIRDDKIYVVDAFTSFDTQAITADLAKYKNHHVVCITDASGGSRKTSSSLTDIAILKQGGYIVDSPANNPPVRDRINSVNKLFVENRILINQKCERLILSLQTHTYKENGEPEKFNEHKNGSIDDWTDAIGYLVHRKFPITATNYKLIYQK